MARTFKGKIILFGEYTIITGSKALVIPLKIFSCKLQSFSGVLKTSSGKATTGALKDPDREQSNRDLYSFYEYLSHLQDIQELLPDMDLKALERDIEKGLYFASSIPIGYGAGSSAALVSAVYDAYGNNNRGMDSGQGQNLPLLRKIFGQMESFFHGTSSGIDPLSSFTGRAVLVDGDTISTPDIRGLTGDLKFFLLDSGKPGETGPLVKKFKVKLSKDPEFKLIVEDEISEMVNQCIRALIAGKADRFSELVEKLSIGQLWHFHDMIPDRVRQIWTEGLRNRTFFLKLCGSGGGGFFLGFTKHWSRSEEEITQTGMQILPLDL